MIKPTMPIRAAIIGKAYKRFDIQRIEIDTPHDDELLVRIEACGICQTDIDFARHVKPPSIFGHEGAGVVERVGPAVNGIKPGDHVLLSYASCGTCGACVGQAPYACDSFWELNFGFTRYDGSSAYEHTGVRGHFFGQSSFATRTLVTAENVVKIEQHLPLDLLAPLGCGLQTGAGTIAHVFALSPGASIVIFGVGAVGLGALMAARTLGASTIVAVDILPQRLTLAQTLGATHVFNAEEEADLAQALNACTNGGFDYAVDTSNTSTAAETVRHIIGPYGRCAFLASHDIIQGNSIPQRFIPQMIKWYEQGTFPLERLITFYDFSEIEQAFADVRARRIVKAVLKMPRH